MLVVEFFKLFQIEFSSFCVCFAGISSLLAMDNAANSLHLRDASFSAYLRTSEENFAVKLAESIQSPYLALASTQEAPYPPVNLGRTMTEEEGELRVFGAEKYFNMKVDDGRRRLTTGSPLKQRQMKEDRADLPCTKPKIKPGTPSACSEASWNSHTALLPRLLRNPSQNKQRKANARMIFPGFGCNGSCSDKKSVYVDTNAEPGGIHGKETRKKVPQNDLNPHMLDRTRLAQPGFPVKNDLHSRSFHKANTRLNREEYYGCPITNSGPISLRVKGELVDKTAEEEGRKSIEVFGSHMLKKGDVATNLERKLSVLTWDAIPKAPTVPVPTISEGTGAFEDNESDASSDLFEIENLSSSGHPLFSRQPSDGGLSTCTRYEPSEASIEWSVVTASAADFSFVSDSDEQKPVESTENAREVNLVRPSRTKSMVGTGREAAQRSRPTGLLGCRSDKAVKVSEPGYRTMDKAKSDSRWHHRLDSSIPLGKPQGENKVKDFEFPQVQHAFA